ncbi:winged helix-turn-helix domain-containing protein [Streptomyces sp. NPDC004296]|uniref:winged helix-turn-helix domain-containing protein n=1 Tax=Streptomyces sp. NPDC004296 TaxID=3364697 RepID=UPI0036BF840B
MCAAGLVNEDACQRAYHSDREVLAWLAAHEGATTRQVAVGVGVSERVVIRNLERLTEDGLLVVVQDGETPALRSYRLAPWAAAEEQRRRGSRGSGET